MRQLHGPKPAFIELPDGSVAERAPETVVWRTDVAKVIGEVRLRHRLTPLLQRAGGHTGQGGEALPHPARSRHGHAGGRVPDCARAQPCRDPGGGEDWRRAHRYGSQSLWVRDVPTPPGSLPCLNCAP
jgi:hypothetical protein